jgi:glycine/D-amino acid oxidase-like deaminating enzyme
MKHTAHGWWLEEAGPAEPALRLEGEHTADVAIVGGGYTGMWTAWHALAAEPGARVLLLEADRCGHGPSGRNGGFCESLWVAIARLRDELGDAAALELAEASRESVEAIGRWCEEEAVDAWFRRAPYLLAGTSEATQGAGSAAAHAAAALGAPERVQRVSVEEVRARCNSPLFRDGTVVPDSATVQPARLALGLRERLRARGAAVFERSPVRRVRALGPRAVELETDGGRVRAGAAVLAAGPSLRALPPLRSRLTVTSSHIVLTEPVPDVLEELGWTGGESITDGRTLVHYFRTTPNGRIVFGWGGGRLAVGARVNGRVEVDASMAGEVRRDLVRLFPQLERRRITHAWGGPIDVSPAHVPHVGELPGGPVQFAFGYTGNGVGPSHLVGRVLAARALDRRDEASRLPLPEARGARVPPEPLAWLGGSAVRAAWVRRERLLDEGRRVDPLTRAVCAVPELLGIHLAR